jgi:hypothetical protein
MLLEIRNSWRPFFEQIEINEFALPNAGDVMVAAQFAERDLSLGPFDVKDARHRSMRALPRFDNLSR